MVSLPSVAEPLVMSLGMAFSEPTVNRMVLVLVGAILLRGRRSVTAILGANGPMTSSPRVFSRAS